MKKALLILIPLLAVGNVSAKNGHVADSLLTVLDNALGVRHKYVEAKQRTIDNVHKKNYEGYTPLQEDYLRNKELINLYRPYIYDSAMHYAMLNRELAECSGDAGNIAESKIAYSFILTGGGMYKEAIENLNSIKRSTVPGHLLPDYYLCYEQTYHHLSIYSEGTPFEHEYRAVSMNYVDSLRHVVADDSEHYFALSRIYSTNGNRRMARAQLQDLLDRLEVGTHGYAIVSSTLADCYDESAEEHDQRKQYLILSAISDISSAVKEYVSLSNLAALLHAEGDVERAYNYGAISMEDANFYNARLRRIEMSKIYPIIDRAYKTELDRQNERLREYMLMISLLAALMFVLVLYVTKQTFELRKVRRALLESNDRLTETNKSLVEANRVKEEYLGRFLSMCSSYINRLERYRSTIHNKLTAGKAEEVRIMTRSTDAIEHEIKEFYRSFDKAFLRLYPNFIDDFNALLRPGERIEPKEGELLPTEIRIYALVRLGISDPASIARFLRYSANTVYTYRHKTRSKAINKETFEEDILNIGF